jgi:glycosyltransferase involved in cell wall biosynthesis
MSSKNTMEVSVIVNEEKNIANCLNSIKSQTYPQEKIEIIVVDNNSIDRISDVT